MKQTNEWLQDVTTSQGWGQYRSIYFVYWVNFGLNFRHKAGWFVTFSSQCCEKTRSEWTNSYLSWTNAKMRPFPPSNHVARVDHLASTECHLATLHKPFYLPRFILLLTNERSRAFSHPSPRLYRNKPVLHSKLNVFRANRYRKVLAGAPFQPFVGVFLILFHEKHHFFIYSYCKTLTTKHHI